MALVVFLRGINVGGHRRFRPSLLAAELRDHDVTNVGATGTFVVRKPGPPAKFRAELLRRLPLDTEAILCRASDLLGLERDNPFATRSAPPDTVRFVSILAQARPPKTALPISIPAAGDWFVRILAVRGRFVLGLYRRQMKTIGYLGQLDRLFGVPLTTRSWTTIRAVAGILKRAKNLPAARLRGP
jgi:uncharacterized protein (DUF1697 family)